MFGLLIGRRLSVVIVASSHVDTVDVFPSLILRIYAVLNEPKTTSAERKKAFFAI